MKTIARLQKWYMSQCNGNWEHDYGITIESCDNPGWWVKIALNGTALQDKPFAPVEVIVTEQEMDDIAANRIKESNADRGQNWMFCRVRNNVFDGAGGPTTLDRILQTFLDWAEES